MPKATIKKTTDSTPAEIDPKFAPIVRAFAGDKKISLGKMFGSVGLKTNGKVFAMLVKGKFVAKLPKERVADLVASTGAKYFDPGHGKLMKEWVALAGSENLWINLAKEARRFVEGGKS
jgi:TfoX/Sxy family transcriptional regulator of competence genes